MPNQKFSSTAKITKARMLAIYELDKLIDYVGGTVDPELKPHESVTVAAFVVSKFPEIFEEDPGLLNQLKEIAKNIKRKGRGDRPMTNDQ